MGDPHAPLCGACDRPLFDGDEMHTLRAGFAAVERERDEARTERDATHELMVQLRQAVRDCSVGVYEEGPLDV